MVLHYLSRSPHLDWRSSKKSPSNPRKSAVIIKPKPVASTSTTPPSASGRRGIQIPLHARSKVMVYKEDLIHIFSNIPAVYTARLAELIFGPEMLANFPPKRNLALLEPIKMDAMTSECCKHQNQNIFKT